MHNDNKNRRGVAGADMRALSRGGLPEIFAVHGADKLFQGGDNLNDYYPYDCQRCGACCRHVDRVTEMKTFNRGDGVCKHLTEDNLCEIYSERPPLCNGEYLYKKFFSDMSVEEFHEIINMLCKDLRRQEFEELP